MYGTGLISDSDVKTFIDNFGGVYEEVQKRILEIIGEFSSTREGKERIHLVYTRADKQEGWPFKDVSKIAQKINEFRDRYPKFDIENLHDIVGITIVVNYPSDIEFVRDRIDQRLHDLLKSHADETNEEEAPVFDEAGKRIRGLVRDTNGYFAHHYHLSLQKETKLLERMCELQIKTVLHDAWGAKTHNLTYKPETVFDDRLKKQTDLLGETLAAIDQQSEILKDLIQQAAKADRNRKLLAKAQLIQSLEGRSKEPMPDAIVDQKNTVLHEIIHLSECITSGEQIQLTKEAISEHIVEIGEASEFRRTKCRLYTLLACVTDSMKMTETATLRINLWIYQVRNDRRKYFEALCFKSLASYAFGQLRDATKVGEEALEVAKDIEEKLTDQQSQDDFRIVLMRHHNSLAYFYAELIGSHTGQQIQAAQRAHKNLQCAKDIFDSLDCNHDIKKVPDFLCKMQDTEGVIRIATATSIQEVEQGMVCCENAVTKLKKDRHPSVDDEELAVQDSYLEMHRIWGYRRIVELDKPN